MAIVACCVVKQTNYHHHTQVAVFIDDSVVKWLVSVLSLVLVCCDVLYHQPYECLLIVHNCRLYISTTIYPLCKIREAPQKFGFWRLFHTQSSEYFLRPNWYRMFGHSMFLLTPFEAQGLYLSNTFQLWKPTICGRCFHVHLGVLRSITKSNKPDLKENSLSCHVTFNRG